MSLSAAARRAAKTVLTHPQIGESVKLVHRSTGKYDPSTGLPASAEEPETVRVVFVEHEAHETAGPARDGTGTGEGQPEVQDALVAAASVVKPPRQRDEIHVGTDIWQVVRVATVKVAGMVLLYRLTVRR